MSRGGARRATVTVTTRGRRVATLAARVAGRGRRLLTALRLADAELSLMLVSDAVMRRLNRDWRGADRPTDVLSFAQAEGPGGAPPGLGRRAFVVVPEQVEHAMDQQSIQLRAERRRALARRLRNGGRRDG